MAHIDKRLEPFKPSFVRDVTRDDILKLLEIKMKRILKFNADSADTYIQSLKDHIDVINDKPDTDGRSDHRLVQASER